MNPRNTANGSEFVLRQAVAYLLFWPAPIDAAAWTPLSAPAWRTGRIMRLEPDGNGAEIGVEVAGRPLGLDFDARGNLFILAGKARLLSIAPDGTVVTMVTGEGGLPFKLVNDVAVSRNGLIDFSVSSHRFGPMQSIYDLDEHRPYGRLLAYDPENGQTTRLMGGLYYPNGIAISPDQTYLLLAESGRYRVLRYYLGSGLAGQSYVFIENLPGFPEGLSNAGLELFWLALVSPRVRKPSIGSCCHGRSCAS